MALTIYGTHRSRTMRVLWTAAELGLDYQHVPLTVDDPWLKSPAFLAISPNGTIPAIVDDGFALAESMAINLYLTKRHAPGSLYPESLEGEADAWRWSLWAQGQLEPWVMQDARLADLRGAAAASMRQEVELNVAGVLSPSRAGKLDLEPCPQVRAWLERCYGRPAALGVRARYA